MAAPLVPAAGIALKYALVAGAAFALARALPARRPDPRIEAAMDAMPDGVMLSSDAGASRIGARWRKVLPLGGAGLRVDAALLARLKVARA